jgi:DNA replication initiation complex subunit (GINS family)
MITYESLREFARKEKSSQKLTELPESFFHEARSYLENKAMASQGKEDMWELDNSRRVLQDLLDAREGKLVNLALIFVRAGVTPGKLLPEEKNLFDSMVMSIRDFQEARKQAVEGKGEDMQTIACLDEVPAFVGVDMKTYGPLSKGDIAMVPKENSDLLVGKGLARTIESK